MLHRVASQNDDKTLYLSRGGYHVCGRDDLGVETYGWDHMWCRWHVLSCHEANESLGNSSWGVCFESPLVSYIHVKCSEACEHKLIVRMAAEALCIHKTLLDDAQDRKP